MGNIFQRMFGGAPETDGDAPAPAGVARRWASPDGLSLFARDYAGAEGEARLPVVCIHGLTRNSKDFEGVAPVMAAAGRRVLALDVRGRGQSARDANTSNYNPAVYAGDVAALLGAAGISRAVFVGTSMGGIITMTLATMRPDLIAGALLNDIGAEIASEGLTRIAGYVGKAEPAATWAEAAMRARAVNGEALPRLTDADWMTFARRTWREEAPGRLLPDYDPAIAEAFSPLPPGQSQPAADLWPLFTALAMARPLLLIRGATSDLLKAATADRMQAAAPQMRRLEVADTGHAPTLDEPESRRAILDFLAEVP